MLEQRRAQQKGYITLKEAAEISGYAPDYIGQLIRGGKIRGEQVYANVAWVTTEDEVRAYMTDKSRTVSNPQDYEKIAVLSTRALSYVLYTVITVLVCALLVMQYILYVSFDDRITSESVPSTDSFTPEVYTYVTI